MRTSPALGAARFAVAGLQHLGVAVAADDGADARRIGSAVGSARAPRAAPVAAVAQVAAQVLEAGLVDVAARPSRAARAPGPAASRRSTPSARRCGRRRSPASASRSRRSAAAAPSPRRCSRCSCSSVSESVSSCSRMRLPSFSVKLRTQPTWSLRSSPSMRLVGDDVVPPVVAVEVAQHRPDALDRRVDHGRADDLLQHGRAHLRPKCALQRVEAALEHAVADRSASSRSRPRRSRTRRSIRRSSARRRSPA